MHPDELFGGYPWFYRGELRDSGLCPWSRNIEMRTFLLADDFSEELNLPEYIAAQYALSLNKIPRCEGDSAEMRKHREVSALTQGWFMQTLLERMESACTYSGLSTLAPFADYRLAEYLWNVPWEFKYRNGVVKGLLRDAFADLLPPPLLTRKKSPFPKTYNPQYTRLLQNRLREIMHDSSTPLLPLLNKQKTLSFIDSFDNPNKPPTQPWFGQLMAAPQMLAYLIQIDYFLRQS
jgi:asparagine synthase (glutamine-hydrolysing)